MDEAPDISKTAWVNVFSRPSLETLTGELAPEDADAFAAASEALGGRAGWNASLVWLGLPWRWAIAYSGRGGCEPAFAYLIPDPRGSRVCIPVSLSGDTLPDTASLTKPVRTVLERSAIIAGYIWAEWTSADFDPVAVESLLAARSG